MILRLSLATFAAIWAAGAHAQSVLTVMPSATVERTNAGAVANVEAAEAMDRASIEREFELLNTSAAPKLIRSLRASCGCESTTLLVGGKPVATATLAPGQSARVRVSVALKHNEWMNKQVQITVMGDEPERALAVLAIDVRQRWFTLSTATVNLNAAKTQEFSLTVAAGLPKEIGFAPLLAKASWLQCRELKSETNTKGETVRRFKIASVDSPQPGRYQAPLEFQIPPSVTAPSAEALRRMRVVVLREVENDLKLTPASVSLPEPARGASRQVVIWSTVRESLATLEIAKSPVGIKATIGPLLTAGGKETRYMRVITVTSVGTRDASSVLVTVRSATGGSATITVDGKTAAAW